MKKIIYFFAGALVMLSVTAFAATNVFTDQGSFTDSWFENAAVSMNNKGIITGYPDGSFGPSNQVSRAELAVILDRMNEYRTNKMENYFESNIEKAIDNTLKFSEDGYKYYTNFLVLAESDLKKVDGVPKDYGTSDWEEESVTLPEGYKLYGYSTYAGGVYYLHFQGTICIEDTCDHEIDQWYGPFYAN